MSTFPGTTETEALFSKHHIGGRNGHGGFPSVPPLHGSLASTVYEADPSCCPQIEAEQMLAGYAAVQVIPRCVGRSEETVSFNLNFDPYTSSFLSLNQRYTSFYQDMGRYDYTYKCAMSPVRQIPMSTTSIDQIDTKFPVDFLSLDTQGSELDILRGAEAALANAVGVETEVSFREIYAKSALFGEISAFLNALGFEFICFTHLTEDAPRTMPLPGRARKAQSSGDALFLRVADASVTTRQRKRLVFASLAYGQIEYAAHCVKTFDLQAAQPSTEATASRGAGTLTWLDFVDEFISIVSEYGSVRQPRMLSETITLEQSLARFSLTTTSSAKEKLKLARLVRNRLARLPHPMKVTLIRTIYLHQVAQYFLGAPSRLEALFKAAGIEDVARELRVSRFRRIFPLRFG